MRFISKGFTLIELLIVVAIIAILAAIAVPNFLEAQTRSKVSRVKSDQRSLATAAEAYYVDWNAYPPNDNGTTGWADSVGGTELEYFVLPLSTPVAYITSALYPDPFGNAQGQLGDTDNYIVDGLGHATNWLINVGAEDPIAGVIMVAAVPDEEDRAILHDLRYLFISAGPDRYYEVQRVGGNFDLDLETTDFLLWFQDMASLGGVNEIYDPTNGTMSQGEIMRSHKGMVEGQHMPAGTP